VQPDENEVIFCLICGHFLFCLLESIHSLANAWTTAEVAAKAPRSRGYRGDAAGGWRGFERNDGWGTDCRVIRRILRVSQAIAGAPDDPTRAALPHLKFDHSTGKPEGFTCRGAGLAPQQLAR
jgi:hypothetical protein